MTQGWSVYFAPSVFAIVDVGFVETLVRMDEGATRILNLTIFQPDLSEVDFETSLNLSIVLHQEQGW